MKRLPPAVLSSSRPTNAQRPSGNFVSPFAAPACAVLSSFLLCTHCWFCSAASFSILISLFHSSSLIFFSFSVSGVFSATLAFGDLHPFLPSSFCFPRLHLQVMDITFEFDPFADILPEPGANNDRAGAKFQPKAKPKPHPRKETKPKVASNLTKATITVEKPNTAASILQNSLHHDHALPVFTSTNAESLTSLTSSSYGLFESQDLMQRNEFSHPELPLSNDGQISVPVDNPTQPVTNNKDDRLPRTEDNSSQPVNAVDDVDLSQQPSQLSMADVHGNLQFGIPGLVETADIFSELESFDAILSQSTVPKVNTVRKFQPKVKINAQPRKQLSSSPPVINDAPEDFIHYASTSLPTFSCNESSVLHSSNLVPAEVSSEYNLASQGPINNTEAENFDYSGDFLIDAGRLNREEPDAFTDLESFDVVNPANNSTRDCQLTASETEYLEENLTSTFPRDGFHEFSTMRPTDSAPDDTPSEFEVTEQLTSVAVDSGLNADDLEQLVGSQTVNGMSKKQGIRSRKRKISLVTKEVVKEAHSRNIEELSQGNEDETCALHALATGEGNEAVKPTIQLRKQVSSSYSKPLRDGDQENEEPLDGPTNDFLVDQDGNNSDNDEYKGEEIKRAPRKTKKLARENEKTVRRGRKAKEAGELNEGPAKKKFSHSTRRNRRQVNKDLLETEEEIDPQKLMIKDLILLAEAKERMLNKDKKTLPSQSVDASSAWDGASYDNHFGSEQDMNTDDGEAMHKVDASSVKINYHSFMERTPKDRWSKQDTELFYEGVRQFGTDFAMIQQLFPGRTRHQVKLKYKKEERQCPLKLHDALTNRSKDHSHFELVIERLQQAAAAAAAADENSNGDKESAGVPGDDEVTTETNEDAANSKLEKEEEAEDLEAEEDPKFSSPVELNRYKNDYEDYGDYGNYY